MARKNKQLAIWDVKKKQEITVNKKGIRKFFLPNDATDAEIEMVIDKLIASQGDSKEDV